MKRQQFNTAVNLDKRIEDINRRINLVESAHTITFENGTTNPLKVISGEYAYSEIKTSAIAKLTEVKKRYEKEFEEL